MNGDVSDGEIVGGRLCRAFSTDKTAPSFMTLMDDFSGIFLVLGLAGERKLVLGLPIGDLVDPEPLIRRSDKSGKMSLNVLDIIQLGGKWILNVNDKDLPVGLALIEQSHDTEHLDLLNLANITNLLSDFADIKGVIVTLRFGLSMYLSGILPGLRECAVVPDVTVVGEAVTDEAKTTFFDILFNGVETLLLRDLHLRVCPSGNLNDHVEDTKVLISEEGDIMERRYDISVLLDVNTVLKGMGSANETRGVLGHGGGCREITTLLSESSQSDIWTHALVALELLFVRKSAFFLEGLMIIADHRLDYLNTPI